MYLKLFKILFCCCCNLLALCQENLVFHRITTEQGLAHDNVTAILQDKKGFIWIGTSNGVCKYDGSRISLFRHDRSDSTSLSDNNINTMMYDSHGRIWVATYWGGLNVYDEKKRRFNHYKNERGKPRMLLFNTIFDIAEIDSSHILIAQDDISILDVNSRKLKIIERPKNTWSNIYATKVSDTFGVYTLFVDHTKKCWLTGEAGLVIYDPVTEKIDLPLLRKDIPDDLKEQSTGGSREDKNGNIWIASNAGLFEYNRKKDKFSKHYPTLFSAADCKTLAVKIILCDDDNSIWFGTSNGLFHYFPLTGKYFVYRNNPTNNSSISDNNIICLYKDRQGTLWVGTANGLNAVYPIQKRFTVYQSIPGNNTSLQSNITRGSFKDEAGNIWVGTQTALECINEKTQQVNQYYFDDPRLKNFAGYSVMPILKEDSATFWIGTWGNGVQLFDYRQKKFLSSYVYLPDDTNAISSNHIKDICKDDKGNLWIATWNGGVEYFNVIKKTFKHYNTRNKSSGILTDYISSIFFDGKTCWAGSGMGIFKYDPAVDSFKKFNITNGTHETLSHSVIAIAGSHDSNLWLGTFMGLLKFDPNSGHYNKVDTVGGEMIAGIYTDEDKSLWLATSYGLKRYHPSTNNLVNYTLRDGLPIAYFPLTVFFSHAPQGEILVNTEYGLVDFNSRALSRNTTAPQVHITSLKIENKELGGLGDLTSLRAVTLKHDQNYIAIGFAAINFINPSLNQYSYKLDGVDKEWVHTGNHNEAVYTNLEPGNYTFHVKASNDAGVWNEKGISFSIHIERPWWGSWWFYILIILTAAYIIYAIYRIRINRILAEQHLRNKIARDLHDDIGSTLSGLKLFSNIALKKLKDEGSGATAMVERIGQRSENIIDAMSDIVWSIDPRHDSIGQMMVRMKEYAAEMLENKNIAYKFLVDEKMVRSKLPVVIRKEVYLVFKEAVNNAMKHSDCGNILIELKQPDHEFIMTVKDDGKGFDETLIKKNGNGLINLKTRAHNSRGEISIISKVGEGTAIVLSIPVT